METHICLSNGFLTASLVDLFGAVPCQFVYLPLELSAGSIKLDLYSVVAGLTGISTALSEISHCVK